MDRVLIVDDDPVIRRLLQINFRLADFEVETAGGGEEALLLMERTHPEALVIDITMPDMDGFEVVRRMRRNAALQDVKVVILSARSREEDHAEAIALGAAAYLMKPFDPVDLIQVVRDAVGDGTEGAAE